MFIMWRTVKCEFNFNLMLEKKKIKMVLFNLAMFVRDYNRKIVFPLLIAFWIYNISPINISMLSCLFNLLT